MDRVRFVGQCFPTSADFSPSSRMDYINFSATQFQPRINIARYSSEVDPIECAERVEAMVSTAILHQEDIWEMLLDLFPDNAADDASSHASGMDVPGKPAAPSCQNAADIKRKLQNATDWCRLAQRRLQYIITANSRTASSKRRSIQCAAGGW